MRASNLPVATPWQAGCFRGRTPELLFGTMHEDPAVELNAFAPFSRVFCIASAGCTARALAAAGHDVTAVDINPRQILYAQARAGGAPAREGTAERLLSRARTLFPLLGWTESRRRRFLLMHNPSEQLQYWKSRLDTRRWRIAVDTFLSAWVLGFVYASPFVAFLPRNFGAVVRTRLERTWANHPNDSNPYAWRLFLGTADFDRVKAAAEPPPAPAIRFVCADAATYLDACEPASFDAFSLSNIIDGAPGSYRQHLCRSIKRAAAPGAIVITRSLAEPPSAIDNLAARDRSFLWGTVHATRSGDLCSTF
jgi:S-adenosylmethionine:diacylglycerol 3-amino-3-carboxypropyl transferase